METKTKFKFFNINGKFGRGPYGKPDYPDIKSLLAEMDRLGVWQSVACHVHARDLNPTQGNKETLAAIENEPEADGRILPSLTAAPAMSAGSGEIEFLTECLRTGKSAVIELFPASNRYRLVEMARIFEQVEQYHPVVMIDAAEMNLTTDIEDLVLLAHRFSGVKFVVRQAMWGQFSRVYDAMDRAKIYLDSSWLHMRRAVELVCKQFGGDRLLFGLGPKSHAGASIGALAYSGVPDGQKQRVAHTNFIDLLPAGALKDKFAANAKYIPNRVSNTYWNPFLAGKGAKCAVTDAHGHTGTINTGWYLRDSGEAEQVRALDHEFGTFNYEMFITSSGTALFGDPIEGNRQAELLMKNRKRFRGYLVYSPYYAEDFTEKVLDDFFDRGFFVGFKFLPDYIKAPVDDKRWRPAFNYADRYHMPILVHTWDGAYDSPAMLAGVAADYPDATVLFAHTGGGEKGRMECEAIAQDPKYNNCMFEFCGSFCNNVEWSETLKKMDHRRVVFGTDASGHDIGWEMGRLLSMDIDDEKLENILGRNMRSILAKSKKFRA